MMGQMHIAAWGKVKGTKITMVADTDPRRASGDFTGTWANIEGGAKALDFSKVRGTTDPAELMADPEVDLIDICVPTPFPLDLALAAIASGKHVLCEKPLARTSAEARKIVRAAAKGKGFFMPAMCIRFWPEWAWLKRAVEKGTYGAVISAEFRRVGPMPPGWFIRGDLSGGAILDLHLHDTDFVNWVFGTPKAVSTGGWIGPSGEIDHVHTRYIYEENGPVVTAEGSWAASPSAPFDMSYRVIFEKATADFRLDRSEAPLMLYRKTKGSPVKCPAGDGYQAEMAYFAKCIRTGKPPETVTAAEAAQAIRIVEAEAKSANTGKIARLGNA
jgi:predicted dehydrogenase